MTNINCSCTDCTSCNAKGVCTKNEITINSQCVCQTCDQGKNPVVKRH